MLAAGLPQTAGIPVFSGYTPEHGWRDRGEYLVNEHRR